MTTKQNLIHFGPFEVTDQVFYNTPLCYCLCNIKPIQPGHVLVIPYRRVPRLTDLTVAEITDLFTTVQKVEKMLARVYFKNKNEMNENENGEATAGKVEQGSFNVAMQDGPEAGQTVAHVHCHVIPRTRESSAIGDGIYEMLQGEEGNVGGGLWDVEMGKMGRPGADVGRFEGIEDEDRKPRSREVMNEEARFFREQMELVD